MNVKAYQAGAQIHAAIEDRLATAHTQVRRGAVAVKSFIKGLMRGPQPTSAAPIARKVARRRAK